jgi:hypothetical protein
VQVTVDGTTYELSFFTGSYNDNTGRFNTTEMPWWGDNTLAEAVANQQRTDSNNGATVSGGVDLYAFGVGDTRVDVHFRDSNSASLFTNQSINKSNGGSSYVTGTVVPAEIPEIDGAVLAQLTLVLGVGWLTAAARRKGADEGGAA